MIGAPTKSWNVVDRDAYFRYILALADDHLILSHRLSLWCGYAPMLEEDLAVPNIALDLLGQADLLYQYAAEIEGLGRTQDQLAYMRFEHEYYNLLLVERDNRDDFAHAMLQVLYFSLFMMLFWQQMQKLQGSRLIEIAAKAAKETNYHVQHAQSWLICFGCGTDESRLRLQRAVDNLYAYTAELFDTRFSEKLPEIAIDIVALQTRWQNKLTEISILAEIALNPKDGYQRLGKKQGGRQGEHTEDMGFLLAQLQYMQQAYPGLEW